MQETKATIISHVIRLIRRGLEFSLIRFGIIGGISFLLYAGAYVALSRWLWISGNHTIENLLSILFSSFFNFYAHRSWTYRSNGKHHKQIPRYLVVTVTATLLQSCLFWLGHEYFHIYDFAVIFIVAVLVPIYTYLMHRVFTFRDHPKKEQPPVGNPLHPPYQGDI